MAVNRRVNGVAGHHRALHHRDILAMHGTRRQLFDQSGMGAQRTRHHHQTGGVLVEPVHDAGTRQLRQFRIIMQQGIDHGAARISGTRMHHQPGRLVDHQHIGIGVKHLERNVLGNSIGFDLLAGSQRDGFAAVDRHFRLDHFAIEQGIAGLDPFGQARARELGEHFRQSLVETFARHLLRHGGFNAFGFVFFDGVWRGLVHGINGLALRAGNNRGARCELRVLSTNCRLGA